MNKFRLLILLLTSVLAFLLPATQPAQAAAWYSPNGDYFWSVYGHFCRNGAEIVARHVESDTPDSQPHFVADTLSFSAYRTTVSGTQEPQKRSSVPIGSQIGVLGLLVEPHTHPLYWTDDESNTNGYSYIYGQDYLTWSDLPLGTTVAIKQTTFSVNYFVGVVTDCRV